MKPVLRPYFLLMGYGRHDVLCVKKLVIGKEDKAKIELEIKALRDLDAHRRFELVEDIDEKVVLRGADQVIQMLVKYVGGNRDTLAFPVR